MEGVPRRRLQQFLAWPSGSLWLAGLEEALVSRFSSQLRLRGYRAGLWKNSSMLPRKLFSSKTKLISKQTRQAKSPRRPTSKHWDRIVMRNFLKTSSIPRCVSLLLLAPVIYYWDLKTVKVTEGRGKFNWKQSMTYEPVHCKQAASWFYSDEGLTF